MYDLAKERRQKKRKKKKKKNNDNNDSNNNNNKMRKKMKKKRRKKRERKENEEEKGVKTNAEVVGERRCERKIGRSERKGRVGGRGKGEWEGGERKRRSWVTPGEGNNT